MSGRLAALACTALVGVSSTAFATTSGPNGCGTDGVNRPSYWGFSRGWDEQLVPVSNYFCHLVRMEGNWTGSGPGGNTQGPAVLVENDGYWHVVTGSTSDVGIAQCSPNYCFVGANSDYQVEWDNQQYPYNYWNEAVIAMVNPYNGPCDYESNNNGWPGIPGTTASLTMIQGWPGGWGAVNGYGEFAGVTNHAGTANTLYAQNCVQNECSPASGCWGNVEATFASIFVGSPYTTVPVYPYVTGWTSGTYSIDLGTKGSDGICYFTYVQGAFRNSLAEVYIDSNDEWIAHTIAGSGWDIQANYACMSYRINH